MATLPVSIADDIQKRLSDTVLAVYPELAGRPVSVRKCDNPAFGDYQSEFALSASKVLKRNPIEVAEVLSERFTDRSLFEKITASRPGFLNFTLTNAYLEDKARELLASPDRAVQQSLAGRTIVIDYAGPNMAKTLHVGHMRPIIVGNALFRILQYCGAALISDNHIGDWGTQFGKLIVAYRHWKDEARYAENPVAELERLYQLFEKEKNETLEDAARLELLKLQQGDAENRRLWQEFVTCSLKDFDIMIERLDVRFDHTLGESFYQPMLADVVRALLEKGIAHEDQGAVIVNTDERYKIHGPLIVRKKDGASNYATTDLATVLYRLREWRPDRIIYVTDARQQDHFRSVFAVVDEWLGPNAEKAHVYFGSIKGPDGKPFKTREGNTVGLKPLIDEAVERARAVVEEKNPSLPEAEKADIADAVGIGSIKYAELNHDLKSDTIFDWNRMLSLEGNTAPYHLYTHARIRSVLRKYVEENGALPQTQAIRIQNETERNLIMLIDLFSQQVKNAATDLKPNYITEYLLKLGSEFNFYYNRKDCPVLKEADAAVRESRTALYRLTGETIKTCLSLLGIRALDRM